MKVAISRRFTFEAAHFLPEHPGKCKNLHGHRWELIVTISCPDGLLRDNMVMDYAKLKQMVEDTIIGAYDHQFLNDLLPETTSERLALHFFKILQTELYYRDVALALEKITLKETENSICEVTRD